MTKRPGLRTALTPAASAVADEATRTVEAIEARRAAAAAPAGDDDALMASTSIHLPLELLNALTRAANWRAEREKEERARERRHRLGEPKRPSTRPSVSKVIVEILSRHLDEIEAIE